MAHVVHNTPPAASPRRRTNTTGRAVGAAPLPEDAAVPQANRDSTASAPTQQSDRTVLILASRFPPVASVGSIRVRKFAKYLSLFGWRPVVLTGAMHTATAGAQDTRRATDIESLRDLPRGLPVYRLSPIVDDWHGHLSRRLSTALARATRPLSIDEGRWLGALGWRFQRLHDRLSFPDRGIWRLLPAVRLALHLHKRYRFDAIFSSGMPFSDHLIAGVTQTFLRRPWLADFRDPWVEYIHWQQWQSERGRWLTEKTESAVVCRAARVISVNDHMTQRFAARYPELRSNRFVTIPNGFDPTDFPAKRRPEPRTRFRLLYAGSLYGARSPKRVLQAFRQFLDAVPGSRRHACFEFAGRPGSHADGLNADGDPTVRYRGFLSHVAALRAMCRADVNVVLLPNIPGSENDTTTKIYECLGSGRPILAVLPPNGAAARVLDGADGVWQCNPDDTAAIARAIRDLYHQWLSGTLHVTRTPKFLQQYTRRHQTKRLGEYLDAVVSARTRAAPTA